MRDHQPFLRAFTRVLPLVPQPTDLLDGPVWTLAARRAVAAEVHGEVGARHGSPHALLPLLTGWTRSSIS